MKTVEELEKEIGYSLPYLFSLLGKELYFISYADCLYSDFDHIRYEYMVDDFMDIGKYKVLSINTLGFYIEFDEYTDYFISYRYLDIYVFESFSKACIALNEYKEKGENKDD